VAATSEEVAATVSVRRTGPTSTSRVGVTLPQ